MRTFLALCVTCTLFGGAASFFSGCTEMPSKYKGSSTQPQPYIEDVTSRQHQTEITPNGHINTQMIGR